MPCKNFLLTWEKQLLVFNYSILWSLFSCFRVLFLYNIYFPKKKLCFLVCSIFIVFFIFQQKIQRIINSLCNFNPTACKVYIIVNKNPIINSTKSFQDLESYNHTILSNQFSTVCILTIRTAFEGIAN